MFGLQRARNASLAWVLTINGTSRTHLGDNIHTAMHIARECGILPEGSDFTAIEGPAFRKLSEEEMKAMLPNMRVSGAEGLVAFYRDWE